MGISYFLPLAHYTCPDFSPPSPQQPPACFCLYSFWLSFIWSVCSGSCLCSQTQAKPCLKRGKKNPHHMLFRLPSLWGHTEVNNLFASGKFRSGQMTLLLLGLWRSREGIVEGAHSKASAYNQGSKGKGEGLRSQCSLPGAYPVIQFSSSRPLPSSRATWL